MSKKLTPDGFVWYRRFPSRALAGMRGLPPEEKGVYGVLIDLCYEQRGPLVDDDLVLSRACDCGVRTYRRIKSSLVEKGRIVVDEEAGTIFDERAIREIVSLQLLSESKSKLGRKGAAKRWEKKLAVVGGRDVEPVAQFPQTARESPVDRPLIGPNSNPFSNKNNAPAIARREEKKNLLLGKRSTPEPRVASLPSGSDARVELSPAERAAKLEAMKQALIEASPEEFPSPPPGDRKAKRKT